MSASNRFTSLSPHILLLPSGIGSLTPFLQLAAMASSRKCKVTFLNIQTQASGNNYYSSFFYDYSEIELLEFEIKTLTASNSTIKDPFIINFRNINHSLHQIIPILSSKPISAIFCDFALVDSLSQITSDLNISLYVLSTTSAQFFSIIAYLPLLIAKDSHIFTNSAREIEIPGLGSIPKSNIPPAWTQDSSTNHLLTTYLLPNARSLSKVKGVLLNTFDSFEPEAIAALRNGRVLNSLPPVFPIGPLQSCDKPQSSDLFTWLNEKGNESVVYVNFGRQEMISRSQRREMRKGLEICGYKYLWVIQESTEIQEFSESEGEDRKGKIVKGWVKNGVVLAHPAIGVLVNNCEWELVMFAAWHGVPMLAWPQHGDQKMNAETVEKAGLGVSVEVEKSLEGAEIGQLLRQMMEDFNIKKKAKIVKRKARESGKLGGNSAKAFSKVIEMLTRGDAKTS